MGCRNAPRTCELKANSCARHFRSQPGLVVLFLVSTVTLVFVAGEVLSFLSLRLLLVLAGRLVERFVGWLFASLRRLSCFG